MSTTKDEEIVFLFKERNGYMNQFCSISNQLHLELQSNRSLMNIV
jgi:hypothetical protein